MDILLGENEPESFTNVQDITQRLAYLHEKVQKLDEDNDKATELRD